MIVEISTWDHWGTAVAGQTLATSLSEADSGNLEPFSRLLKLPSGILGKRPFEAKSWPGALASFKLAFWMAPGRLLTFSSGLIGKQPFRAKSWPGAFWSQIVAIWHLSAGYGNCLVE